MTQTPGAEAPQENTTEEDAIVADLMGKRAKGDRASTTLPPLSAEDEKTVTIQDLCRRWEMDPAEAEHLQKFMGQTGPWTDAEAEELDRRMCSMAEEDRFPGRKPLIIGVGANGKGGPHGPDCECGDLSPEELEHVEGLMALLAPALAEALGVGRTPAEKRTGVSDPEAAILDLLGGLQPLVDAYGKAAGAIGAATGHISTDPFRAVRIIQAETEKLRKNYRAIRDVAVRVSQFLPAVKGTQATDAEGLPIWFLPATVEPSAGWLTTAQAESPGEDWRAVYIR